MRFSIITICFNSEKTIERTIKSVLAQTYKDYEYIIVDGASQDGTLDIVKKYEPLFEGRMQWKSEPDKGIYNAMNKGIERAQGTLIGIVNSDDWLETDALSIVDDVFAKNDCDENSLYCGGINYHGVDGKIKKWNANIRSFKSQVHLYIMSGIRHPATFVPMHVYEKCGLYNDQMKLSADQDFVLRCYYKCVGFIEIPAILSNMSEGGLSTSGGKKAQALSRSDRKMMLREYGKKGVTYLWLYYSWYIRGILRRLFKKMGLYH